MSKKMTKDNRAFLFVAITSLLFYGCNIPGSEKESKKEPAIEITKKNTNLKPYGVFTGLEEEEIDRVQGYETVVIDALTATAEQIENFHTKGSKVYSYINVGTIESFRDYFDIFQPYALGPVGFWDEEQWINISEIAWQKKMDEIESDLIAKGIDGFFVDNCDIYYVFNEDSIYNGLVSILSNMRSKNMDVMVNGGNTFVERYLQENGDLSPVLTGVNQETVFTSINFENSTFGRSDPENLDNMLDYLEKVSSAGVEVFLLEYTTDQKLADEAQAFAADKDWKVYVTKNLELC